MTAILNEPVIFPYEGRTPPARTTAAHTVPLAKKTNEQPRNINLDLLLKNIEQQQLDGRGGAHFPTITKLRAAIKAGPGGIAVANAAEGEPASIKDAALWFTHPHLVLDGLQIIARLINAKEAIVWIHSTATEQIHTIQHAINERNTARRDTIPTRIVQAPDRYVSGQSHAIVNALQSGPAVPHFRKPGERAWGDNNPPILVHNTETLARIAHLAAGHHPDHTLVTLVENHHRIAIDVANTTTFADLYNTGRTPQAVLLGGYAGTWVTWDTIAHLPVHEPTLKQHGISLGAGTIIPIYPDTCPIRITADLATWLAHESARQCGPCLYGTADLASDMTALSHGQLKKSGYKRLLETLNLLPGRGGCSLPDGTAAMITSAITTFPQEVEAHMRRKCGHLQDTQHPHRLPETGTRKHK